MHKFIASFATAAALLAAGPAFATDPDGHTAKVRYADLDLSSAQGRATLDRRIAAATEQVCGSYAGAINNEERDIAHCRADAGRKIATQVAALRARDRIAAR